MQLGLALLVVPLIVATTLLAIAVIATLLAAVRSAAQASRRWTDRLDEQDTDVHRFLVAARQRLIETESRVARARGALARDAKRTAGQRTPTGRWTPAR